MLYRIEAGKIRTRGVEYAAADHCNLRCAGCSHMSPFLRPNMSTEDELARDLGRLATVMLADELRILGGEPLLNPRIVPILKAAKASGIARHLVLTTNGLLLGSMPHEFWENVDEVRLSLYPGARPSERTLERIGSLADEAGTYVNISGYPNFRVTMVTDPHPADKVTRMIFRTCENAHRSHCHMVHSGWLYKCACPPYLAEFLGKMDRSGYDAKVDGFEIHAPTDLRSELWKFLTNDSVPDACRYCLGWVGKRQKQHQLTAVDVKDPRSQPISRRSHLDKIRFVKESVKYFYRRAAEAATQHPKW
jgi:cyclic pyranopterin phosphate synthase